MEQTDLPRLSHSDGLFHLIVCAEINSSSLKGFLSGLGLQWWGKITNVDTKHPTCLHLTFGHIWSREGIAYILHSRGCVLWMIPAQGEFTHHYQSGQESMLTWGKDLGVMLCLPPHSLCPSVTDVQCCSCLSFSLVFTVTGDTLQVITVFWPHLYSRNLEHQPSVNTQQMFSWVCRDLGKWKER